MAARLSRCSLGNDGVLKRFRDYCDLIKITRSGFPWEKATKRSVASIYTNCENRCNPAGWAAKKKDL
jgi:hypothetical protein